VQNYKKYLIYQNFSKQKNNFFHSPPRACPLFTPRACPLFNGSQKGVGFSMKNHRLYHFVQKVDLDYRLITLPRSIATLIHGFIHHFVQGHIINIFGQIAIEYICYIAIYKIAHVVLLLDMGTKSIEKIVRQVLLQIIHGGVCLSGLGAQISQ